MTVYLDGARRRHAVTPGRLLGEGASGKVHQLEGRPGEAVKIYHDSVEREAQAAKVALMLDSPPDLPPLEQDGDHYPQIAWPTGRVFDDEGRFIGFTMPEISFGRSTSLVNLLQRSSRRAEGLSDHYGYRVLVARNLASVTAELHRAGHHIIDMKPANFRFYPQVGWMAIVDTDGFSVAGPDGRRAPAGHVSDEYIAPESWKKRPDELGQAQDEFALAVIVFQLLNNGLHPFAGSSGAVPSVSDIQGRIVAGLYPYGLAPRPGLHPSVASLHDSFPDRTRRMFDDAFLAGRRRPAAIEWRDHLADLLQRLVPCAANPAEHVHFGAGCGVCAQERRAREVIRADAARKAAADRDRALRVPDRARVGAAAGRPARARGRGRGLSFVSRHRRATAAAAGVVGLAAMTGLLAINSGLALPVVGGGGAPVAPSRDEVFPEPRAFVVLPGSGAASVNLRSGPGTGYAAIGTLLFNEDVSGFARTPGEDGRFWVRVARPADGVAGYVAERLLMAREVADGAPAALSPDCAARGSWQARTICSDQRLTIRYDLLQSHLTHLSSVSGSAERDYLVQLGTRWSRQRDACEFEMRPALCLWSALELAHNHLGRWEKNMEAAEQTSRFPPSNPSNT